MTVTAAPPANTINLGTATSFGVLAGTLITNNADGTTLVTGDVGAPAQAVDPAQATGYSNYRSGAVLANALEDMQSAVTDANGRPCDIMSAPAVDLGGLTLTPGVYCYGGAISISGTVTFSGLGLYIFRTAGAFNTTVNSHVALTGGAADGNVLFVPAGAAVLGANSVFKGTLLTSAGAITVSDGTTVLTGRMLTGAALTMQNNQITVP